METIIFENIKTGQFLPPTMKHTHIYTHTHICKNTQKKHRQLYLLYIAHSYYITNIIDKQIGKINVVFNNGQTKH